MSRSNQPTHSSGRAVTAGGLITRLGAASMLAAAGFATPAAAQQAMGVKVELGKGVSDALTGEGLKPEAERERLEMLFNAGLKAIASLRGDIEHLYGSGQTIRIICVDSAEAKKLGIDGRKFIMDAFLGGAPAEIRGDFDAKGNRKRGLFMVSATRERLHSKNLS